MPLNTHPSPAGPRSGLSEGALARARWCLLCLSSSQGPGGDNTLAVTSTGMVTWEEVLGPHCLGLTLALPFVAVQPSASPRTMPGALRPAGGPMRQGCCHCRSWRPAFLTS